ncbi:MAG: glycosyltransferase family protein [Paracoccaceae bacterium]
MTAPGWRPPGARERRVLLYSHDTFGLGHLRRSRTIATALVDHDPDLSALIVTGSPIAGRFDFPERVDHVRLPGVVKMSDGTYQSSNLRLDIDRMVRLRGEIIRATDAEFGPDLVIVDKEPWGFRQELADTLAAARARGARIVLGIRDVLDEEDALAREWERKGAVEAIERFYDEIWIYGIPEMCTPLAGLGLSPRMEARVAYTGYLRRDAPEGLIEPGHDVPDGPYVLVTTGGGGDGAELVDWVLGAYEADPKLAPPAMIVYGPFLPGTLRAEFDRRVSALEPRVRATGFHGTMERLLAEASGVVAMGGYNTFCEILSTDKPAVIVPRTRPRQEQLIRAAAAERLGLLRMLQAERDGTRAEEMVAAIRGLAAQPRPSEVMPAGMLEGLANIAVRSAGERLPARAVGG